MACLSDVPYNPLQLLVVVIAWILHLSIRKENAAWIPSLFLLYEKQFGIHSMEHDDDIFFSRSLDIYLNQVFAIP
jgi:hypothetical protein